jgi:hypothetical protein
MATTVAQAGGSAAMEAIFGRNALRCFGLDPQGPNRQRQVDYYAKRGISTPAWMTL